MSFQVQNVFDAIRHFGHDEDFQPQLRGNWRPTNAVAGTTQKLEVLRRRVELGVPLFHPNDNRECLPSPYSMHAKPPSIRFIKLCLNRNVLLSE